MSCNYAIPFSHGYSAGAVRCFKEVYPHPPLSGLRPNHVEPGVQVLVGLLSPRGAFGFWLVLLPTLSFILSFKRKTLSSLTRSSDQLSLRSPSCLQFLVSCDMTPLAQPFPGYNLIARTASEPSLLCLAVRLLLLGASKRVTLPCMSCAVQFHFLSQPTNSTSSGRGLTPRISLYKPGHPRLRLQSAFPPSFSEVNALRGSPISMSVRLPSQFPPG